MRAPSPICVLEKGAVALPAAPFYHIEEKKYADNLD